MINNVSEPVNCVFPGSLYIYKTTKCTRILKITQLLRNVTYWNLPISKIKTIYIKLYFQNSAFNLQMERPASDNISVLSADMENLTVVNQQAVNTERGMFLFLNINQ